MTQALATTTPTDPMQRQRQAIDAVVADFGREDLLWASGYLAGLAAGGPAPAAEDAPAALTWQIYYATETGNSRRVAGELAGRAREAGLDVATSDLRDVKPRSLARAGHALFVVATHGVGDAPDGSEGFFDFWFGERAPSLEGLHYSVLALGDSSYADFCEIGRRLDERLEALGATRIAPRRDCDLDYEEPAAAWRDTVVEAAGRLTPAASGPRPLRAVSERPRVGRDRPWQAPLLAAQPITGPASGKAVWHLELDIEGAGLDYLPGDSIGVWPSNPPELVDAVLAATGLDGDAAVHAGDASRSLRTALTEDREITGLSRPFLEAVAGATGELRAVLDDRAALRDWLKTRQVIDVLAAIRRDWEPQFLVDSLRRLTPRLYSIASAAEANPGEVHLTVSQLRYKRYGREHWGSASNFLVAGHDSVPVYLEPNERFRLPVDGATPIIMIGAGTGVAPYRAFLEYRQALGQRGDNWLVFGERRFADDFLYQLEWLRYRRDGILTRLDVAFSRDQAEKIYVQHRLLEQSADVWRWLQRGAQLYVCGDADHMAVDVHAALLQIVAREGGMREESAAEFLDELKSTGRYQRDVY